MLILCAALPIVFVMVGIVVLNKPAMLVAPLAFVFTLILGLLVFKGDMGAMMGVSISGGIAGAKVVYMIWAAFIVLNMLLSTGAMEKIKELIITITDDRRKHVVIVAFCFGAFLEGVAGAGTPAAIAAPCLVGLGISPMAATVASLISNGIPSSWGAAGLTTSGGFAAIVSEAGLATYPWAGQIDALNTISMATSRISCLGAIIVPWLITIVLFGKKALKGLVPFLLTAGLGGAIGMLVTTHFIGFEFTSIIWGLFSLICVMIYIKIGSKAETPEEYKVTLDANAEKSKVPAWKALFTYGLLLVALPIARFTLPGTWVYKQGFAVWIGSTILVVCIVGSVVLGSTKDFVKYMVTAFKSVIGALIAMVFLSALAEVMKITGMLSILAKALADSVGRGYPAAAVLIGSIGSFMTGTTLGSNIMFHPMHIEACDILGINRYFSLGAQCAGGALGNMICPNNVVAVCATVGFIGQEGIVMRKVIKPICILWVVYMIAALVNTYVLFPGFGM